MKRITRTICALGVLVFLLVMESTSIGEDRVVVMTFNVLHGGTGRGQPLSQTAKVIEDAKADIVGLQEAGGSAEKLAEMLGWNQVRQGRSPAVLTRHKIVESYEGGARVQLDSGREVCIFNIHLPPAPYQPYQLLRIPYGKAPFLDTEQQAIASAEKTRGSQIAALLKQINAVCDQEIPVFVTGDFNEPSHLDWTEKAAQAERHPIKVAYPGSLAMVKAGFKDAWRTAHPDELKKPGYTWTPVTKAADPKDHHDRIDFVYFRGKGIELGEVSVVGENEENADLVVSPYPSDHRAVAAAFALQGQLKE